MAAEGATVAAARNYGAIFDRFPVDGHAMLFASSFLDALAQNQHHVDSGLVFDAYHAAFARSPGRLAPSWQLAYALAARGKFADAVTLLSQRVERRPQDGPYLLDDLGIILAAWKAHAVKAPALLERSLTKYRGHVPTSARTRHFLVPENDGWVHLYVKRAGRWKRPTVVTPDCCELLAEVATEGTQTPVGVRLEARAGDAAIYGTLLSASIDDQFSLRVRQRPFVLEAVHQVEHWDD